MSSTCSNRVGWSCLGSAGTSRRLASCGSSMRSQDEADLLDLERGLPVTREDIAALRQARSHDALTWDEYAAFLAAQPSPSSEELRARPLLTGEPFRVDD
jgi:hypothetical protein